MKHPMTIRNWLYLLLICTLTACSSHRQSRLEPVADSLNDRSYACRYREPDTAYAAALRALQASADYPDGEAEALNNLGFCAFMQMDFEEAEQCHRKVYDCTHNELERLVADVGLMKICQRTAQNKEFYDHRHAALRRMKRIAEDKELFTDSHRRRRLAYARSEFAIVSAIYHYYLQQRPEAVACIRQVADDQLLAADTAQWLYYHYIVGAAGLTGDDTDQEGGTEASLEELTRTLLRSLESRYSYFEANSLQSLAGLLLDSSCREAWIQRHRLLLPSLQMEPDSLLPLLMAERALRLFRHYDDHYQIASTYVTIARYHNQHGHYTQALDTLQRALECVNAHPRTAYDCLSRIREQLSVTYAGLEWKEASDYNRNIYLDILDDTRQDKELESRYDALGQEVGQLNLMLATVGICLVLVVLCFVWLNRLSRARHRKHLHRLHLLLDVCQQTTASIPSEAQEETEITDALQQHITPLLEQLFGQTGIRLQEAMPIFPHPLRQKEQQAMLGVIEPYIRWAVENGRTVINLGEEQRQLESQRYLHELHIADHKRQNVVKKACMALVDGIRPYIDRIIHEVQQLRLQPYDEAVRKSKYSYISDLTDIINEYNDILALWIKMRKGTLSLSIETFALNELFELIRKGEKAFEMKQVTLEVTSTDALVKADKSLTLFMINTLADNARKYTPAGGKVHVYAQSTETYVEISVADNGCGLSAEDVARIVDEKVYDPRAIGSDRDKKDDNIAQSKGSGFGLMNCRGIIEKYRKSGELFQVCTFRVESEPGRGSRFYFRLPRGVQRTLGMLCLWLWPLTTLTACHAPSASDTPLIPAEESQTVAADADYARLLDAASAIADSVYYCNIDRRYDESLVYADSAIRLLNLHYSRYAHCPGKPMVLAGSGTPAEIEWWNSLFNSDFHVILDIRNELSVAFLALKRWEEYSYNNEAYTRLYKLLGEDRSLEAYCRQLENSANNKLMALLLAMMLLLSLPGGYYFLYDRKRMKARWHLEQVLATNRCVMDAVADLDFTQREDSPEEVLHLLAQRMADTLFASLSELTDTDSLTLMLRDDAAAQGQQATHALHPATPMQWQLREELARRCLSLGRPCREAGEAALPLRVEAHDTSFCIGVMSLHLPHEEKAGEQILLLELVARYLAMVVYNAGLKLQAKCRDIELAQDETRRAAREESQLHVQNLVLDNCLSTIKHETLYYPNKIKQLVVRLTTVCGQADEERSLLDSVGELIEYYKGIFTLLSRCASRQLEEITFRRTGVEVETLFAQAQKSFRRMVKGQPLQLQLHPLAATMSGDAVLLRYLLENLLSEALAAQAGPGILRLTAAAENSFVRITFTDPRRSMTQNQLNELFYPSLARMTTTRQGELRGTEFLICKQIVRDHDEYVGRRGCRIEATPADGGGFSVSFTIPSKSNPS